MPPKENIIDEILSKMVETTETIERDFIEPKESKRDSYYKDKKLYGKSIRKF